MRDFAIKMFIGLITKKKTAAATRIKEIKALIKSPYIKTLPFIVNLSPEKSGTLAIAAISGVRIFLTKELTTVPKAAPTTTPTAKSTTFPLNKNDLNSFNIVTRVILS